MNGRGGGKRLLPVCLFFLLAMQPAAIAAEITFNPLPGMRAGAKVESLLERRWKHVSRQSLDVSCGSAALATILQYQFGDQVTEEALIRAILKQVSQKDVSDRGGFTLLDLKKAAIELGYTVHGYKLTFERLVELNSPVLVPITVRGFKHFVVFRGMLGDRVVLADPAFGNMLVPDFLFESIWKDIALVITKDGKSFAPGVARLAISEHDAYVTAETPEALRSFLQQNQFMFEVDPDEF